MWVISAFRHVYSLLSAPDMSTQSRVLLSAAPGMSTQSRVLLSAARSICLVSTNPTSTYSSSGTLRRHVSLISMQWKWTFLMSYPDVTGKSTALQCRRKRARTHTYTSIKFGTEHSMISLKSVPKIQTSISAELWLPGDKRARTKWSGLVHFTAPLSYFRFSLALRSHNFASSRDACQCAWFNDLFLNIFFINNTLHYTVTLTTRSTTQ
jgi:hypothetical protein